LSMPPQQNEASLHYPLAAKETRQKKQLQHKW